MAGLKALKLAKKLAEEGAELLAKKGGKVAKEVEQGSQFALPKEERKLAAPAVKRDTDKAAAEKIYQHAAEHPAKYKKAEEPVFEPANPELTKKIVPQSSIAKELPQYPDPSKPFPLFDRSRGIHENRRTLARMLANTIEKSGTTLPFYSTGTVLEGLAGKGGLTMPESRTLIRDWAGQGAATSPRTRTPPNIRNASHLLYQEAQGNPITYENWLKEGNVPGFPMIGKMHIPLSEEFFAGTADPLANSKPFTFRENWSGNMADVTADTHNIRAILDAYDRLFPGTLQRQWFDSQDAFDAYRAGGGFPKTGSLEKVGIKDTAGTAMIEGRKTQTEYPILQGPTKRAAKLLGISPAEAQERLWFAAGPRTGLKSPPMTIPDLLNAQFEETAKVLGITPEEVMQMWARRRIPLAENEPQNVPGETAVG